MNVGGGVGKEVSKDGTAEFKDLRKDEGVTEDFNEVGEVGSVPFVSLILSEEF